MKKVPTVTIGIPAYNEQQNIQNLLRDIDAQSQDNFLLVKIIVASDGSDDQTVKIVKNGGQIPITIIDNKTRNGKAFVLNQIVQKANADILVLFDADVQIKDKNFITKLIRPILKEKADLTSAKVEELPPQNFLQAVLKTSMDMKKQIFAEYKQGNNLFTCHGRSRALSKKLYRRLRFINSAGEDAYSYIFAVCSGFQYQYVDTTTVYYELPRTFQDHQKQSTRYLQHDNHLAQSFSADQLAKMYYLPKMLVLKHFLQTLFHRPIHLISYGIILVYMRIIKYLQPINSGAWSIAQSSKSLQSTKVV